MDLLVVERCEQQVVDRLESEVVDILTRYVDDSDGDDDSEDEDYTARSSYSESQQSLLRKQQSFSTNYVAALLWRAQQCTRLQGLRACF